MKGSNGEFARVLMRKADHDWINATSGLQHEVPLDTVCFHIQQTAEKLLKALLVSCEVEFPLTHDLDRLLKLALPHFPALARFKDPLPAYSAYATVMRYEETDDPTLEETSAAYETVEQLRELVHALLPPEKPPQDAA